MRQLLRQSFVAFFGDSETHTSSFGQRNERLRSLSDNEYIRQSVTNECKLNNNANTDVTKPQIK